MRGIKVTTGAQGAMYKIIKVQMWSTVSRAVDSMEEWRVLLGFTLTAETGSFKPWRKAITEESHNAVVHTLTGSFTPQRRAITPRNNSRATPKVQRGRVDSLSSFVPFVTRRVS